MLTHSHLHGEEKRSLRAEPGVSTVHGAGKPSPFVDKSRLLRQVTATPGATSAPCKGALRAQATILQPWRRPVRLCPLWHSLKVS
jgi:hypothetical protein